MDFFEWCPSPLFFFLFRTKMQRVSVFLSSLSSSSSSLSSFPFFRFLSSSRHKSLSFLSPLSSSLYPHSPISLLSPSPLSPLTSFSSLSLPKRRKQISLSPLSFSLQIPLFLSSSPSFQNQLLKEKETKCKEIREQFEKSWRAISLLSSNQHSEFKQHFEKDIFEKKGILLREIERGETYPLDELADVFSFYYSQSQSSLQQLNSTLQSVLPLLEESSLSSSPSSSSSSSSFSLHLSSIYHQLAQSLLSNFSHKTKQQNKNKFEKEKEIWEKIELNIQKIESFFPLSEIEREERERREREEGEEEGMVGSLLNVFDLWVHYLNFVEREEGERGEREEREREEKELKMVRFLYSYLFELIPKQKQNILLSHIFPVVCHTFVTNLNGKSQIFGFLDSFIFTFDQFFSSLASDSEKFQSLLSLSSTLSDSAEAIQNEFPIEAEKYLSLNQKYIEKGIQKGEKSLKEKKISSLQLFSFLSQLSQIQQKEILKEIWKIYSLGENSIKEKRKIENWFRKNIEIMQNLFQFWDEFEESLTKEGKEIEKDQKTILQNGKIVTLETELFLLIYFSLIFDLETNFKTIETKTKKLSNLKPNHFFLPEETPTKMLLISSFFKFCNKLIEEGEEKERREREIKDSPVFQFPILYVKAIVKLLGWPHEFSHFQKKENKTEQLKLFESKWEIFFSQIWFDIIDSLGSPLFSFPSPSSSSSSLSSSSSSLSSSSSSLSSSSSPSLSENYSENLQIPKNETKTENFFRSEILEFVTSVCDIEAYKFDLIREREREERERGEEREEGEEREREEREEREREERRRMMEKRLRFFHRLGSRRIAEGKWDLASSSLIYSHLLGEELDQENAFTQIRIPLFLSLTLSLCHSGALEERGFKNKKEMIKSAKEIGNNYLQVLEESKSKIDQNFLPQIEKTQQIVKERLFYLEKEEEEEEREGERRSG